VDDAAALDPRIERTRRVVLEATLELLVECGYGAVSIEAVAARSGVAKSTIYRHWPNRMELVNDAFQRLKPPIAIPDEGTVRDRVVHFLEGLAQGVAASTWSQCLPALIDASARDPEARELHARIAAKGRQVLVDLLAEGAARGELPPDLDAPLVAEALVGPIFVRRIMFHELFDPADVRHLVDQLLPAGPSAPG